MAIDELIRQVVDRARQAADMRAEAERERRQRRRENDHYVMGGVNWDGFSLEHLIKMVAERASPGQLDALAGEWRTHGEQINRASVDLQRSLGTLMQFWSGQSADDAGRLVTRNATWITELGTTAQNMANPIQDAGGALRSAQDTMPGKPSSSWWAGAGGGAAAGFAVGGPVGAAFGAAIGGIASAFGFGSSKKKLKRKAVQTMQRYEGALLGIDGTTPQFGLPSDGGNPGGDPLRRTPPGVGTPGGPPSPPGGGGIGRTPFGPGTPPRDFTNPSGAIPGSRWPVLTGVTPSPGPSFGGGTPPGGGFGGLPPGMLPPGGGGRGLGGGRTGGTRGMPGAGGLGAGRGLGQDAERRAGRAGRAGGLGAGGMGGGGRGAGGQDSEHQRRVGRGAGAGRGGYGAGGLGAGGRSGAAEDGEHRARGRFGRAGLDPHGGGGYGGAGGGAGGRPEEDDEHHRKFPVEEDPFSTDLKAAPPVIGL